MGSKTLGCFPRRRCWRQGSKQRPKEQPPSKASSDAAESAPAARANSTSSEADSQTGLAYFSSKARVSFRHQLDSEREWTS